MSWSWLELLAPEVLSAYFRASRPRHSANWPASVPSIGAQSRSTGGKICLARYQSMSGFSSPDDFWTSRGEKARLAAEEEVLLVLLGAVVM